MSSSYLLTSVLNNIKTLSKLTSNDAIMIVDYYDTTATNYIINVIYDYKNQAEPTSSIMIHKSLERISYTYLSNNNTDLLNYITGLRNDNSIITANVNELVPSTYNDRISKYDNIFYVPNTTGFDIYIYDRAYNVKCKIVEEAPFEELIHSKPMAQSDIFKLMARRLVASGFQMIHKDTLVNTHPVTRFYVYRDIYFCFYKDYAVYVGFSLTDILPTTWQEFTNVTENSLDTTIREYLINNWYNPNTL